MILIFREGQFQLNLPVFSFMFSDILCIWKNKKTKDVLTTHEADELCKKASMNNSNLQHYH